MRSVLLGAAVLGVTAFAQDPASMPPLTWLSVPNTHLRAVQADPMVYPELQSSGFGSILSGWSGAAWDSKRNRLVIWGGGEDYRGNELYVFELATMTWRRLNEPTHLEMPRVCTELSIDGGPRSRQTFNGLAYLTHVDRFFAAGGSRECPSGGCGSTLTWTFYFDLGRWENRMPAGMHGTDCQNFAVYDPQSRRVFFGSTDPNPAAS